MTTIEHRELKGITLKNLIVTIIGTASIVASVMTSYLQLKNDIRELRLRQETQSRVEELRIKVLETEVAVLRSEVDEKIVHGR